MKASTRLFIEIALIAASGILINAHDNEKKVDLTEMYKNPLSNGIDKIRLIILNIKKIYLNS